MHKSPSDFHVKGTEGLTESDFGVPLHERETANGKAKGLLPGLTSITDLAGYAFALAVTDDCVINKYDGELLYLYAVRSKIATHESYAKGPIVNVFRSFKESCGIHVGPVYLVMSLHS